jgi:hypothetical protein
MYMCSVQCTSRQHGKQFAQSTKVNGPCKDPRTEARQDPRTHPATLIRQLPQEEERPAVDKAWFPRHVSATRRVGRPRVGSRLRSRVGWLPPRLPAPVRFSVTRKNSYFASSASLWPDTTRGTATVRCSVYAPWDRKCGKIKKNIRLPRARARIPHIPRPLASRPIGVPTGLRPVRRCGPR